MVSDFDKERFTSLINEHFGDFDEESQIIFKGHLLIEESLYRIISCFVFHQDALEKANISFYQKVQLAKSLSLGEHENSVWDLILTINSLRNKMAHRLSKAEREGPILRVKEIYNKEVQSEDLARVWEHQGLATGLLHATVFALGFLSTFEKEAQRFKDLVTLMDKTINLKQHKKSSDTQG